MSNGLAVDVAEPTSVESAPRLLDSAVAAAPARLDASTLDAAANAESRFASQPVISTASVGSTLERELMIGSIITSNSSACADGVMANGVMPNAKNAPALAIKPTTARRSAFALRDRRFRFGQR